MAAPANIERRFFGLLETAGHARAQFDSRLLAVSGEKLLSRSDLPEYLLIGLSYLASMQHRAVLRLLTDPDCAFAAEIQIRGLLEFLAHVAFVLGKETDTPVGTARQRAICLSLARSCEEYLWLVEAEDTGKIERGRGARALERVWGYLDTHQAEGCPWLPASDWPCRTQDGRACRHHSQWPCRSLRSPRPRALVRYTIELLSQRLNRADLLDLYVTGSLMAHQGLLDRIIRANDNVDLPSPATYQYRALILSAAVGVYGQALGWILASYSPEAANDMKAWYDGFYNLSDLNSAIAGEWDS